MNEADGDYYRRRAKQEWTAAAISDDDAAALAHLKLAEAYDAMFSMAEPRQDIVDAQRPRSLANH